jgi:hypothetical protein
MMRRLRNLIRGPAILTLCLTATFAADQIQPARPFADKAREWIVQLDVRARQFQGNADVLESAAFLPGANPALVQLPRLNMLGDELTGIADLVSQLDANRSQEADWQVQLTDRLLVKVRSLRESIQQAIALLGKSDQPVWEPNYQTVAGDIRDQSNGLARTVAVFLRWANIQEPEPVDMP